MIYTTVGLPCRFSEWCEAIFRALVTAARGPTPAFPADRLDQISKALLTAHTASAVVMVRQPQQMLSETLVAAECPVVVTLDTPANAVGALMTDYHECFREAVRRVSNSLTALIAVMKAPRVLVLEASGRPSAFDVAERIVGHFGLALNEDGIRAALAGLPEQAPELDRDAVTAAESVICEELAARAAIRARYGFGDEDDVSPAAIMSAALDPLWAHLRGEPLKEIFWHPALFVCGDRRSEAALMPVDITGSRRCLVFGPYCQLPAIPWSCSLLMGYAPNAVGVGITLDVFTGNPLNSVDVAVAEPGLSEVEMSFVNAAQDADIEIRVFNAKATFEGEFLFGAVRLTPQRAKRLRGGR
jgi:hypothetical protein